MGHDDRDPVGGVFAHGGADALLGRGIDRGGGIVKDHDGGLQHQGAGDRQALALARRKAAHRAPTTVS